MDSQQHFRLATVIGHDSGMYGLIAELLLKGMGMPYKVNKGDLGYVYPNGSRTGVFGMLDRGEADVGLIPTSASFFAEDRLGYSFPLEISTLSFASRKYRVEREIFSIFDPFSFQVWLSLILSSILMTLVLCAFLQKKNKFGDILKNIISSILGKSVTFKDRKEKLIMCFWLLGVMFLTNCYLTHLMSAVTVPRVREVRNIAQLSEEVINGRYQVISGNKDDIEMLMKSNEESFSIIGNRTKVIPNDMYFLLDFLTKSRNSSQALIGYRLFFEFLGDDFYTSDDYFSFTLGSYPVSNEFCCKEKLNNVIHRITQAGLLKNYNDAIAWISKYRLFSYLHSTVWQNITEDSVKSLGLHNLSGAFAILVCGYCVSILCLVVEILMARLSRTAKRRLPVGPSITGGQAGTTISLDGQSAIYPAGTNLVSLRMRPKSNQFDPGNATETL